MLRATMLDNVACNMLRSFERAFMCECARMAAHSHVRFVCAGARMASRARVRVRVRFQAHVCMRVDMLLEVMLPRCPQEREKRRRRVLIEQMKAHEAQEVNNPFRVALTRFSAYCVFIKM